MCGKRLLTPGLDVMMRIHELCKHEGFYLVPQCSLLTWATSYRTFCGVKPWTPTELSHAEYLL